VLIAVRDAQFGEVICTATQCGWTGSVSALGGG
jgi:hypothetical protein